VREYTHHGPEAHVTNDDRRVRLSALMTDPSVTLEITDDLGATQRLDVPGQRFIVGRLPESDVCLPADGVSRQHAEFVQDPSGRWWVRDLGSRNGTRVNGRSVPEAAISGAEQIKIGPYVLRFLRKDDGVSPLTTIVGQVPVMADEPGPLKSLAEMPAPQVQATHLSRLVRFGRDLNEMEDSSSRLMMLCELMVGGGFPGKCAVAVRIARDVNAPVEPQMLLAPQFSARTPSTAMPYLSSRVLSAVRQRMSPVMASNVGGGGMDVQVSIAPSVQAHWAIACPLGGNDQTLDVLYTTLTPAGTTGEWLAIAGLAADQYQQSESLWSQRKLAAEAAVLQQELEQARQVQQQLVPRNISIPGLDLAVEFHPCRWVGGDYLDIIRLDNQRVVLVIADVCGHGMQAALLASTLHAMLNVLTPSGSELGATMSQVNDYFNRTLDPGKFATAVFVELNVQTGQCRSLCAGHPPPVVVAPDGSWRWLGCGEYLPLGVNSEPTMTAVDDQLPAGHVLALYTDGLFEIPRHDGQLLGYRGLAEQLSAICKQDSGSSSAIAKAVVKFIQTQQGTRLAADDQSLLAVRRTV
jgi:phosphoserine phosphatase RsbU/P